MTDNIISLHGHAAEPQRFGKPVPEIVSLLEEALGHARDGRIRSLAIAFAREDGDPQPLCQTAWHAEPRQFPHIWLAVSRLVQRLQQTISDGTDDKWAS